MSRNRELNEIRRRLVLGAAAAGIAAHPLGALAQGLSSRPVRVLLAQTPGTTPDLIARTLAPRLQARWNQPFVVENRPGAAGAIGMEVLATAPPDGHTINVNTSSIITLPMFFKVPFDILTSFAPITLLGSNIFALVVHNSVPAKDVREFIAWAKPLGNKVNYGSPGNGTHHNLFMEMLKLQTGLQMTHIPYKGSAPAFTDLMGGQISVMLMPMGAALAMTKDGKLRILGGTGRERSPLTPAIPSLHEQGVTGFDTTAWFYVLAPAGTPPDIIGRYNTVFHAILAEPEVRDALARHGVAVQTSTPEETERMARAEYERVAKVIKEVNLKVD
jgi:tripartite-type tricarboxylate transporter receptor subunit TctC